MPSVIVRLVPLTVPVAVIVPDSDRSPEPLPHDISTIRTPADVVSVAHVCVPVDGADVSSLIAEKVRTPPEAAPAAVDDSGSSASSVFPDNAASGFVGCVPS